MINAHTVTANALKSRSIAMTLTAASFLFLEIDMSEVKFTNGDWVVYDGDLRYCKGKVCIIEPDDMPTVIADLNDYFGKEERDANAHLIAAAPEMYQVIEDFRRTFLNLLEFDLVPINHEKTVQEKIIVCNKLLAKARGE